MRGGGSGARKRLKETKNGDGNKCDGQQGGNW
jgi:hypothetical protein